MIQGKVSSEGLAPNQPKTKKGETEKTCNHMLNHCPGPRYKELKNSGLQGSATLPSGLGS